jgi:hypothetical protein
LRRFIDYGNVEDKRVEDLMLLPSQLAGPPPFAHLVKLPGLAGVENNHQNMDVVFDILRWILHLAKD